MPKAADGELLGNGNTAAPRLRPTVVPVTESSDPFFFIFFFFVPSAARFSRISSASFLRLYVRVRIRVPPSRPGFLFPTFVLSFSLPLTCVTPSLSHCFSLYLPFSCLPLPFEHPTTSLT